MCFVALLVGNLPYTWSLLIDTVPAIRTWSSRTTNDSEDPEFWAESSSLWSCLPCGKKEPKRPWPTTSSSTDSATKNLSERRGSEPWVDDKSSSVLRFHAQVDAAVINRMMAGELEDSIDLEKMSSRNESRKVKVTEKEMLGVDDAALSSSSSRGDDEDNASQVSRLPCMKEQ